MAVENIFKDEATEEKGERARMASFVGAMAIADLVKTTLGPKGMDKILQSTGRGHSVTVTNDGATILKSLHIDNPAAKVLIDISKVQDDEVGDGTTSVVVYAGELLREAEKLVNSKIHPMTIISGYRIAADCARRALLDRVKDNKDDAEKFRSDLMRIAMTTLSSKILSQDKEHFAKLAVDAVMRLKGSTNLESIQIIKKAGGSLKDSFLDEGFILDKKIGLGQPKRIENANILVANTAMDTDKVKIYGARVRVDSMAKVAQIEGAEKEKMREKVQKIIGHGINCFVNRQLIYNFPEELFADAGILAIEHADFDGIERLALVTGGEIASTFDNPESVKLGHCKLIEEIMIGEDKLIHFSGVEMGQACTIVLRGASFHVLDEAERSLHDALCVLSQTVNDSRVLLGGGWPEMVMAKAVDELARKTPGKKSHAIEAFSRALIAIPTIIADNAGLDSAELVAQLRAEHHKKDSNAGIDVITGTVGDMSELGISEAFKVKQAVLLSATEAAEMILRVDEIITCAPRKREDRINGEYVKAGLAEMEHWCYNATDEYASSAWDELKHIRQAIAFLVVHQKPKKMLDEISRGLCPILSMQKLYRISTMYWDDKYGTQSVSADVISKMRVSMTEENNVASNSFLLDDDSSIPFSLDDISKSIIQISDIEPPPLIRENSGFSFLLPRIENH